MEIDPKVEKNGQEISWWRLTKRLRRFRSERIRKKAVVRLALRRSMKDGPESILPISELIPDPKKKIEAFARYYDYARKEIDREDSITFSRLNLTLTFQAFLLGATVFLFSGLATIVSRVALPGPDGVPFEIGDLNKLFLFVGLAILFFVSLMGFVVSQYSYRGIMASRKSLHWSKDMWITFNEKNGYLYPSLFPQITKFAMLRQRDRHRTDQGSDFALSIPKVLRVFWCFLAILWVLVLLAAAYLVNQV